MIVMAALLALGVTAILQIYFYLRFFRYLDRMHCDPETGITHRASVPSHATLPVSVLICARNEAANLQANLPVILRQNYSFPDAAPAFEVIVVDDASDDHTAHILAAFHAEYPWLRVVRIDPEEDRTRPGKKFALSRGIAAATYDTIVCTDADCVPATDIWLHCMAEPFLKGKSIVAGYGGYRRYPGALNWFIRYETMQTFFLYYSFWKGGAPYMAVGRNMAATKTIYESAARHPAWTALPSGDDDLLVQLCANRENMAVVTFPGSYTWSEPKRTVNDYILQKRRHVSTGKFYTFHSRLLLSAYAFLRLLRMLLPWCLLLIAFGVIGSSTSQGVRDVLVQAPFWVTVPFALLFLVILPRVAGNPFTRYSRQLCERTDSSAWIVFFFCWILYNAVLAPWILWKTKQRWK